jgi:hypothetical protein
VDDKPGPEPKDRTLQALRDWEEKRCNPGPKGKHWRETHELARLILDDIAPRLGRPLARDPICQYFAHTNSAKCKCMTWGTKQGRPILFQNCRQFIPGEVTILRPAIIVTQGKWARESLATLPILRQDRMPGMPQYGYEVVQLGQCKAIKFDTAHQRRYGLFWREKRQAYPWYAERARQFVLGQL